MQIYVITYSSYFEEIYTETKATANGIEAAAIFSGYINDIIADLPTEEDVWGKVAQTDNGGRKLTLNTDIWCYDVELSVF